MNEAGLATGYSYRFNGGNIQLGQDAWIYNPTTDQTFALNLSTRSDGFAYSRIYYLGENGLALGVYTLFDAQDNNLGDRAFYFTFADGLKDLGSLVQGGLSESGWSYLGSAVKANDLGQILGYGRLTSQSGGQMTFSLMPVPEPCTVVLLAWVLAIACVSARQIRACD